VLTAPPPMTLASVWGMPVFSMASKTHRKWWPTPSKMARIMCHLLWFNPSIANPPRTLSSSTGARSPHTQGKKSKFSAPGGISAAFVSIYLRTFIPAFWAASSSSLPNRLAWNHLIQPPALSISPPTPNPSGLHPKPQKIPSVSMMKSLLIVIIQADVPR